MKDINLEMEELSSEDASEKTGTETKEQNEEEKDYEVNASVADELRDTLANLTSQNEIAAGEDESLVGSEMCIRDSSPTARSTAWRSAR